MAAEPRAPAGSRSYDEIDNLANLIRSELQPVYHITPGGLKWSASTDALRSLVDIAKGRLQG